MKNSRNRGDRGETCLSRNSCFLMRKQMQAMMNSRLSSGSSIWYRRRVMDRSSIDDRVIYRISIGAVDLKHESPIWGCLWSSISPRYGKSLGKQRYGFWFWVCHTILHQLMPPGASYRKLWLSYGSESSYGS